MTKVTIDIETSQYKLLKALAKEDDSSISRICRKVIKGYITSKKPKNTSKNIEYDEDERGSVDNLRYNEDGSVME